LTCEPAGIAWGYFMVILPKPWTMKIMIANIADLMDRQLAQLVDYK
jgi:hypothetical protein